MDLTEFLLARIAEDEARLVDPWDRPHWAMCNTQGDLSSLRDECDCGLPARVLAECESKRRIIGRFQMFSTMTGLDRMEIRHNELLDVLHSLALPYADHPDYDPVWRP